MSDAEAGGALDEAIVFKCDDLVTMILLLADLRDKCVRQNVWAQNVEGGKAECKFCVSLG